jgi:CHRD domain
MNMNKIALAAALAASLPVLASDPPGFRFRAVLTGSEEVPSVSSSASGELNMVLGGDGNSISYTLNFSGLSSAVQQAHIHFAQPAVNGPIIIWLCGTTALPGPAGTPSCPQAGSVSGVITSAQVLASPATQQLPAGDLSRAIRLLRNGTGYANVHTANSPGGEIRGQVY